MSEQSVTAQSEDFSRWYNEIVYRADLAAPSPVRGCVIIKPYGYETGRHQRPGWTDASRPPAIRTLTPAISGESYSGAGRSTFEGFSPVGRRDPPGGKELGSRWFVRPTSKPSSASFSDWIHPIATCR